MSLNIAGNTFVVMARFVRLVAIVDIIGSKSVERHMWTPSVVPAFEFFAEFRQMIDALDENNSPKPFIFQGFVGSFGDSD